MAKCSRHIACLPFRALALAALVAPDQVVWALVAPMAVDRRVGLPDAVKARLLVLGDQRISGGGVVVIKAQDHRSLERNRQDAVVRLRELIETAAHVPKARRATKPTKGSQRRRVEGKVQRGEVKALRGKVGSHD